LRELEKIGFEKDRRNLKYNLVKDAPILNSESDYYDKWQVKSIAPIKTSAETDTSRD
jgi:hypothetical protein